ncbi:hypothetical protein [Streptomyces sp. AK08-02]|uniref:hypothetical protein n=1 Tax=Streptomyces sp. AK08-02 TaxID=3028654 RepID=UPI0029A946A8|nr:hypothetical protein [Streptomyces sp. AK08-02]MDX3745891.1 hypothetical protein [Streptomyces sp. AK08-02]
MSIMVSPELNNLLFVLIGEKMLQADEDLAYASHKPYKRLGKNVRSLSDLIEESVRGVGSALPPQVGQQYVRAMRLFVDNGGTNYLREFAKQLDDVGNGRVKTSMDIMESKWQIIAELVRLLIELAIITALSFFTGGSSASQIATAKARSRVSILTTLDQLLKRTHVLPSLSEAFDEAFQTFVVRLAMMTMAPEGRRPDGFDWNQILQDGAFGAFAGMFHGAFDSITKNLGKNLKNWLDGPGTNPFGKSNTKNITDDITSKFNGPPKPSPGDRFGRGVGGGANEFLVGGGSEAVAEIFVNGIFNGKWEGSWETFVGAGMSSVVTSALFSGASSLGGKFGSNFDFGSVNVLPVTGGEGTGSGTGRGGKGSGSGASDSESGLTGGIGTGSGNSTGSVDPGTGGIGGVGALGGVGTVSTTSSGGVGTPTTGGSGASSSGGASGNNAGSNSASPGGSRGNQSGNGTDTDERDTGQEADGSADSTTESAEPGATGSQDSDGVGDPAGRPQGAGSDTPTSGSVPTTGSAHTGSGAPESARTTSAEDGTQEGAEGTTETDTGVNTVSGADISSVAGSGIGPGSGAGIGLDSGTDSGAGTSSDPGAASVGGPVAATPVPTVSTPAPAPASNSASSPASSSGHGSQQPSASASGPQPSQRGAGPADSGTGTDASGFDVRRSTSDGGDPVADVTVEVEFTGADALPEADRQAAWDRMAAGVEGVFNAAPGHRLPGGERVQVTVVPVPPGGRAHLKADSEQDLVQRIGDHLGLGQDQETVPGPDSVRTVGASAADTDIDVPSRIATSSGPPAVAPEPTTEDDTDAPSRITTESSSSAVAPDSQVDQGADPPAVAPRAATTPGPQNTHGTNSPTANPRSTTTPAPQNTLGADPPAPVRVTATSQAPYDALTGPAPAAASSVSSPVPSSDADETDEGDLVQAPAVDKGKGRAAAADPVDDDAPVEYPADSPDAYRRELAGYDAEQVLADYGSALTALRQAEVAFEEAESRRASGESTSHGRESAEAEGRLHDARSRVTDVINQLTVLEVDAPSSEVDEADLIRRPRLRGGVLGFGRTQTQDLLASPPGPSLVYPPRRNVVHKTFRWMKPNRAETDRLAPVATAINTGGAVPGIRMNEAGTTFKTDWDPVTFGNLDQLTRMTLRQEIRDPINEAHPGMQILDSAAWWKAVGRLDHRTARFWSGQEARTRALEAEITQQLNNRPPSLTPAELATVDATLQAAPDALTGATTLLNTHQGLILGETHGASTSWPFLINNMAALRAQGMGTIYVEALRGDSFAPSLNAYFRAPVNAPMPVELRRMATLYDSSHNSQAGLGLLATLEAARANGVRVVAMDGLPAASSMTSGWGSYERAVKFNAYAALTVQRDRVGRNDGYIAVIGKAHSDWHLPPATPHPPVGPVLPAHYPGLSQLLHLPSVELNAQSTALNRILPTTVLPPGVYDPTIDDDRPATPTTMTASPGWDAARADATPLARSHTWVDPVSRPRGSDGEVTQYVVRSGFDVRRFTHDGEPVTDLTVQVEFTNADSVPEADQRAVWERMTAGVERVFNAPGHRFPGGDRVHVTVVPVAPGGQAHLKVELAGPGDDRAMSHHVWRTDGSDQDFVHEIGHQLGLRDEYRDATAPGRPRVEGSLMGDYGRPVPNSVRTEAAATGTDQHYAHGGLRPRHLALIDGLIGDTDDPPYVATGPGPVPGADPLAPATRTASSVPEHTLWHQLLDAPADERPALLTAIGDARGGPAPTVEEAALRGRVRDGLRNLPGVTVAVEDAANFGHQAAATMMIESLGELGYDRRITVIAPENVRRRLQGLLSPSANARVDWVAGAFDPRASYDASSRDRDDHLVLVAANDALVGNGQLAANFLHFTGADRAVVLRPYAWNGGHRYLYTRADADADATVTDLEGESGISPSALYRFEVAPVTGTALDDLIAAADLTPEREAGLTAVARAVDGDRTELMPAYGLHNLHASQRASTLAALAEGVHAAQVGKPAVVLALGNATVDFAPRHQAPWLTQVKLDDPTLPGLIEAARPGEVIVVEAGNLSQDLFRQLYGMGSLPAVVEGANTTNTLQVQGRPYFSVRTNNTPYDLLGHPAESAPPHIGGAVATLNGVTAALTAESDWGARLAEAPAWLRAGEAETAFKVLRELHSEADESGAEKLWLGIDEMDRLQAAFGLEVDDVVANALGPGRPDQQTVDSLLAAPLLGEADYERKTRLQDTWLALAPADRDALLAAAEDLYGRRLEELRKSSAQYSVAPSPEHVGVIASAINEAARSDTRLGGYFAQLTQQARDPDSDQVLQALGRVFPAPQDDTAVGGTPSSSEAVAPPPAVRTSSANPPPADPAPTPASATTQSTNDQPEAGTSTSAQQPAAASDEDGDRGGVSDGDESDFGDFGNFGDSEDFDPMSLWGGSGPAANNRPAGGDQDSDGNESTFGDFGNLGDSEDFDPMSLWGSSGPADTATDQPATDQPAAEQPTVEQPITEQPPTEQEIAATGARAALDLAQNDIARLNADITRLNAQAADHTARLLTLGRRIPEAESTVRRTRAVVDGIDRVRSARQGQTPAPVPAQERPDQARAGQARQALADLRTESTTRQASLQTVRNDLALAQASLQAAELALPGLRDADRTAQQALAQSRATTGAPAPSTAAVGADPLAPATAAAEVALRRRVRDGLGELPGVTVVVDIAANFGHQAAATMMIDSLTELGYEGRVTVIAPDSVRERLDLLLSAPMRARVDWVSDSFDPHASYDSGSRERSGHLVLVAANDALVDDEELAAKFLHFAGADQAVVLRPYAWNGGHRYLYTRGGPDADAEVTDLQDTNGIPDSALYRFEVPRVTGEALDALITEQVSTPERAAGLKAVVAEVDGQGMELMPAYGLHNLHPAERASTLAALAEGVHGARLGKPAVVLALGDATVDYAPRHSAPWLTQIRLDDPALPGLVAAAGPGQVIVVEAGNLSQDLFRQVYQMGTLPAVVEGANTTNTLQLQGRPYFSVRTNNTPYDPVAGTPEDSAAVADLEAVTAAIVARSPWGEALEDLPSWDAAGRAETAISVLKALPPDSESEDLVLLLGPDEADRLRRAFGERATDIVTGVLGPDHANLGEVRELMEPDRPAEPSYKRVNRLQNHWVYLTPDQRDALVAATEETHGRYLAALRDESAAYSVAPDREKTDVIAKAVADARRSDSRLGGYFSRLTDQAHRADHDQVLQALGTVFPARTAQGADPLAPTADGRRPDLPVTPVPAPPPGWDEARGAATPEKREHTWLDPVSRPRNAKGEVTQYKVRSGFDVRRFTHDGEPVTDLTVQVEFTGADSVPEADRQAVWDRMAAGVEHVFNAPGHRLAGGERLHVTVVPVPPGGEAHLSVELTGPATGRPTSHHVWRTDGTAFDFAHEVGHQLGLRDESRDATAPQRPQVEGSLMGMYDLPVAGPDGEPESAYAQGGLRPRHLALLTALVGDPDPAPAPGASTRDHDLGADPLAPAGAAAEAALRRRVRTGLENLPGVTVVVDDAANFGHQAAATMLADSLDELGYHGRITVIAPENVQQRLDVLLSAPLRARVDWVTDTFDPAVAYDTTSRPRDGHLVLVAANDALVDNAELAANFLHFTGGDQAVVLKPYAWTGGHRYLYTRTGPDADAEVTDLQGEGGIPDSALFRFPVPRVTGAALDEMIADQASTPERAAGLRAVAHAVDGDRVNLMPAYGMHNLHPSERASTLGALAAGMNGAKLDRPAVLLALGNATVDIAPRHRAPWYTQLTLDDPELPRRIAQAKPGEVIVVEAGNLTQDLFRQVYLMGTLPAVVEGANTSNMLQVVGRPYFSVRTNTTPYDPLAGTSDDAAALVELEKVTKAIVALSEWGEEFENLPAGLMAGRAETARSVLGALPSETVDGELTLYLGYNELVRLRDVFGDETRQVLLGVLGEGHGAMDTIDTMLAPAPAGTPDYKWSMQLQEEWAELTPADRDGLLAVVTGIHERQLADLRTQSATLSVAPPTKAVTSIAEAIVDTAKPESPLGRYFRRLTDQAVRPDNDQVLQALGRAFATVPAPGADPLAPTADRGHTESPDPVPPTPPGWDAARAEAAAVERSHTWVDPVSRPRGADGKVTQYVVRSGFDVRRFTHDGEPVTDLTVHVRFTNADSVPEADRQAVWDRMAAGVERVFNAPGNRLPGGDRMHVTVVPVPPGGHAHLKVRLAAPDSGARTSHHTWRLDGTSQDFVHEVGHQLGLRDESPDATALQRPRVEGSLMGDYGLPVPESVSAEATANDTQEHYTHGGLRPRHLALINALIGDPDPVAASDPRPDPAPVDGADPLAPAPPSPFVLGYGSRHDGNVGLVQVEPLPARVVNGVHQQVLRALGFVAPVAENDPVLAQLRDKLGAEQLVLALPYLRSSMGHRVTVTVGGTERSVDVRLGLRDPAHSPRYGIHDVTDPDVRVERRGFGAQESGDSESSGNSRTVPVPWSVSLPVAAAGALRGWEFSPSVSLTHNQLSLSTSVTQLVQTTTAQRSNELSQAYEFASHWEVRVDSPRMAPPVNWGAPQAHGPVTVWFPQHLAVADTSGTPLPPPAGLDDLPVWGVDTVADPQQLLESVLSAFHDDLPDLSASSAQELEAFLAEPVLRGTLPMQRSGGIFSPLLLDSRGRAIGMFKVTTEVTPGTPTHRSLDTKINLESHLVQTVKVDGQVKITNAVGVDLGVGPAFTGDHAAKHPDASKKVAGSLVGKGGVRWQTSDTLGNGGTATVLHGLRTNRSHLLAPATVRHTVTLVRPGGGETARVFEPWHDGMQLRLLTRESAQGHPPTAEERRALPAELENLESIGITAAPLAVEGPQDLFGHAEVWLRANGFLPPETNVRNLVLPDESLVQAQLNNLRRFEQARSALGLRAATDAMVDGGHSLWLERPTATGTHRIRLSLTAVRDRGTDTGTGTGAAGGTGAVVPLPSIHTRTLPDIQHVSLASFGMAGTEQQASGYGWSLGFGGGPSGPVGPYTDGPRGLAVPYTQGSGTLGGAADYSYGRQTGHTATVGAGLSHDQLFIGSGQGSEVFEIPARFALDLYDGPGAEPAVRFAEHTVPTPSAPPVAPVPGTSALGDLQLHLLEEGRPSGPPPRTVSGSITLAVPHHRTREPAAGPASPAPAHTVSQPVAADHSRLAMTGPDGSPLPGIVKLPDDAIVDVFRGSGVLQEALRQIVEGTHPGHPETGRLGAMASAVGAASPQLLSWAARSVASSVAGQSAGDPTTVAAEVRQAALSPGNLVARAHQIFKGGYVVEGITLPGLGADQEYALEIRGVLHTARHLQSARQYLETGVAAIDSAAQQKSVSGTHQTGFAVTGTRTPATAPAAPVAATPSGAGPDTGVKTASTPAPPKVFGPSGKYAYTSRTEDSGTVSTSTSVNRTATESGMEHRVGADATILITVRRGTRNVVGNTLGYGSESDITVAVDLPEAVQFLMTDGQLSRHEGWFTDVDGLTPLPPAPAELPLPQRFTRTGEPGMAAVLSVTQFDVLEPVPAAAPDGADADSDGPTTGAPVAGPSAEAAGAAEAAVEAPPAPTAPPTLVERRDRLRAELTALVEAEAPGVTQPGHSSYLPGVASRIADYTSTAGLRALPGRGPRGAQRFHFRHLALGGARLVEVTLTARPRGDETELRGVRGRNAGPGTGLEQFHGQTPAGVSTSTTSTTQHGLTFNPTTRYPRPGQDTRTDRSGPGLSVGSTQSQGTKASSTAEDRFWLRTDSAADFDLDYEFTASVRSELVADWPPNLVGGALQGGVLAWYDTDTAAEAKSWISRALSARPDRTATVPASVTLRFTGGEAAPAEVVTPLTPTVDTAAPVPRGARFVPMGPAPVFEFNAWSELTTALDAVAPGQDRGWRSPPTSTSAESTAVRIGELIQAGDISLDHPRTAAGLTDTMPGTLPFESAPGTPPSLSVTLHNPRRVTVSADVTLDRLRIASTTGGSSRSGGTTGGVGFQGVYSTDDPDRVLGGFNAPVLTRQPQALGSSGGTTGGVREWLKTGSTSAPTDGTHGTRTYEALVDAHLTVKGPEGVRHVSGAATVRIGERDALGHGITPPRTQPQVYDLPAMVRAAADAEAEAARPANPDTQGGEAAVAAPELRDWTRHPLRTLPGLLAAQIDSADPAAQLWLALDDMTTATGQQRLGRALFAVSRAAAEVGKPVELVLRADDSTLTFWNFGPDGALSGPDGTGTAAWGRFAVRATTLSDAAAAEQKARDDEFALRSANSVHQEVLTGVRQEAGLADEALAAARATAEAAERAVTEAREAREEAQRDGDRWRREAEHQRDLAAKQSARVRELDEEIRGAEQRVREADSIVSDIDRHQPADDGDERPDKVRAREAHRELAELRATRDKRQTALDEIHAEERTARDADAKAQRVLPELHAAEQQAERAARRPHAALTEATERLRAAEKAHHEALRHAEELANRIKAAEAEQRTQARILTAGEEALPGLATLVAADRTAPPVDVPTGSLASAPPRWPDLTAHATPARGLPPADEAPNRPALATPGGTSTDDRSARPTRPEPPVTATRDASDTEGPAPTDDGAGRVPVDGSFGAALLAALPVDVSSGTGRAQPLTGVDSAGALHDWARGRLMEPGPLGLPPGVRLPAGVDTLSMAEISSLGVEVTSGMAAEAVMLGGRLTVAAVSLDPGQLLQLALNRPESGDYVATVAALAAQALGRDIVIVGPGPVEHRYGSVPGEPILITFDGAGYSTPAHHLPES